ncbi:SH3 domain-containing protein [bacterium]|nr:SH3 domain-containing protein [bacterium]
MMKKIILILALFFSVSLSAEDGFSLYIKKDYAGAYNAFYSKFAENSSDPLYSYNLGVTSEALGRKGEALYFYLQALQNAPDFAEAKNNLDIVVSDLGIAVPKMLTTPVFAVDAILVIFFISLYAFAAILTILCLKSDWRLKIMLLPVFLVMCVSATLYYLNYNENLKENWAVAVKGELLRSGPDSSLKEIGKIREGEIINVVSSSGSWYKVKGFQDNVEGWVELNSIRAVKRGTL